MKNQIHPTALVDDSAMLGEGISIGPYTIIQGDCTIGDRVSIGSHCVIGHPAPGEFAGKRLSIGHHANIRAHTIIYEGSRFGENLETGHQVLIREGTVAGINLRAGVYVDIEGDCAIGDYCRLHSAAIVGQGSRLEDFVWMYPNTVLPNDPLPPSPILRGSSLASGVVMCTGAILQPGTELMEGAYITANSFGKGKVPSGAVVNGPTGQIITHVTKMFDRASGARHPWMNDFAHRYPREAQERLQRLNQRIVDSAKDFKT